VANDGVTGKELWKSDGTASGTELVKDIRAGIGSNPNNLTSVDNKLVFTANDGIHGEEVWRSEGTASSTFMRADIAIPGGSDPSKYTESGLLLYTVVNSDDYGYELWVEYTHIVLPLKLL
jgi:ELWxxDGT repeat protein